MSVFIRTIVWAAVATLAGAAQAESLSTIENGRVKIGIDLDRGGSITYFSRVNDQNLINSHDLGRQIQPSYYSGPHPFGEAHPGWKNWPWNPIGSGDVYGYASKILEHSNDGKQLYVKLRPMQWALKNVPGDCTFETWITLEDRVALVRTRLNNARADHTQYPAQDQELPAVYTIGKLYRLVTYDGLEPFKNLATRVVKNAGPPWASWKATENWAALLDDKNEGVGVLHAGVYSFIGGFAGKPNEGGPLDDPTGYIAPVRREILDHDIAYEYQYALIQGSLDEIRAYAYAHRIRDGRPDARFQNDRQHWTLINATDAGQPKGGTLKVHLDQNDSQMIGPEQWWEASAMPRLYIRAAYHSGQTRGDVFWSVPDGSGFTAERTVGFPVIGDGKLRTYEIDLAAQPGYSGTITGLRFDPVGGAEPGASVDVAFISWKPGQ